MGVRKTTLPSVPEPTKENLQQVVNALKEIVEVGVKDVDRGDALDSYVTFRDVADGILNISQNLAGAAISPTTPVGGGGGPFPDPVDIGPLHLPGRPTGVRTQAIWDGIMVLWDWPPPDDRNITWDRVAVMSSATTDFVNANLIGYSSTDFFMHVGVGFSDPQATGDGVEPGQRYYWVRFEWGNPITGDLEVTDWSPYEYQNGVRGRTATSLLGDITTFSVGADGYPAIFPFIVGEITTGFDDDGNPIRKPAVGLDGQFLVDGTITAQAIQAGTIGAREIFAQSIWTGLMTAENVISSQFMTRPPPDFRLEINGQGTTAKDFPLWYGRGETGGDDGLFWIQNYFINGGQQVVSSLFLSGDMYITGVGKFFAGNVLFDEDGNGEPDLRAMRIEIGGPGTDFLLWAGSGLTGAGGEGTDLESNPVFFIDNFGNAVFRGTVEAEFVSGEISRTLIVNHNPSKTLPVSNATDAFAMPESAFVAIGEYELPPPPFDTGHIPYLSVNFLLFGSDQHVGVTRMLWKRVKSEPWRELNRHVHSIFHYGGQQHTEAIVPERVYGKSWVRLEGAGFDGSGPTLDNVRGILMGIR